MNMTETGEKAGESLRAGSEDSRREAARMMGSAKSEKKAAAARANAQKTYKPMKVLADIVCLCSPPEGDPGLPPFKHKSTCLRGRAIKYRTEKGLPLT